MKIDIRKHILSIVIGAFVAILLLSMVVKKIFTSPYSISASQQVELLISPDNRFTLYDLSLAIDQNDPQILLIDVREEDEYQRGHLPNAINVPLRQILYPEHREYIEDELGRIRVLYGTNEVEAVRALAILSMNGITDSKILNGGYVTAMEHVVSTLNPSYFFYSNENKQFNYSRLLPAGTKRSVEVKLEDKAIEIAVPRGGC